jgi:arginyl-tRNA--protein-N-Asp/Glu arginylyltransferase
MTAADDDQSFLCLKASPTEMDQYWAAGWRHFGILFFRYRTAVHGGQQFSVLPLRIDLKRFVLSRSQKRVLAKNRATRVAIRPSSVDETKDDLFSKHSVRFEENIPSSLDDFLSPRPASVPCVNLELCIYAGDKLVGVTFLDIGQSATSAVYAIFDPAQAQRSLGILMILRSIEFSRARGCRYYYPGYAYREPFSYDYKKRFAGLEYLDWVAGWQPYVDGKADPSSGGIRGIPGH